MTSNVKRWRGAEKDGGWGERGGKELPPPEGSQPDRQAHRCAARAEARIEAGEKSVDEKESAA